MEFGHFKVGIIFRSEMFPRASDPNLETIEWSISLTYDDGNRVSITAKSADILHQLDDEGALFTLDNH